ncbi:TCF3 fusion partner homolog [Drosophila tropicalis]|uniref:TCF3 fusion partner homolog n=1 Tax=Drosophila tropicalis TaxID=46794 RepID=UPI0035ABDBC1
MLLNNKSHVYKHLVDRLYDKCQKIQTENERCVMRVNGIKKMLRRRNNDIELLKRRLDEHGDQWRKVPVAVPLPKGKTEQKTRGPKPKKTKTSTEDNSNSNGGVEEASSITAHIPSTTGPGAVSTVRRPRKQRVKKAQLPTKQTQQQQQQQK